MLDKIKRLEDLIDGYEDQLKEIHVMRLGFLLKRASYNSLNGLIDRYKEYVVGKFSFTVNCHDTGNSVVVNLIAEDGEKLNIINGTYWDSESQYGFNKFHNLRGAWDVALIDAIDHIRKLEITKLDNDLISFNKELQELKIQRQTTISKFESEF